MNTLLLLLLNLVDCEDDSNDNNKNQIALSMNVPEIVNLKLGLFTFILSLLFTAIIILCVLAPPKYTNVKFSILTGLSTWFFIYENLFSFTMNADKILIIIICFAAGSGLYYINSLRKLIMSATASYTVSILACGLLFRPQLILFYMIEGVVGCILYFLLSSSDTLL